MLKEKASHVDQQQEINIVSYRSQGNKLESVLVRM